MTKSESRIQSEIIVAANKNGHRLWRTNSGKVQDARTGTWIKLMPKGTPDCLGFHGKTGQYIAIEVKTKTGKLRPDQIKYRDFALGQPIIYGVARSADEAIEIIECGGKYFE